MLMTALQPAVTDGQAQLEITVGPLVGSFATLLSRATVVPHAVLFFGHRIGVQIHRGCVDNALVQAHFHMRHPARRTAERYRPAYAKRNNRQTADDIAHHMLAGRIAKVVVDEAYVCTEAHIHIEPQPSIGIGPERVEIHDSSGLEIDVPERHRVTAIHAVHSATKRAQAQRGAEIEVVAQRVLVSEGHAAQEVEVIGLEPLFERDTRVVDVAVIVVRAQGQIQTLCDEEITARIASAVVRMVGPNQRLTVNVAFGRGLAGDTYQHNKKKHNCYLFRSHYVDTFIHTDCKGNAFF